MSGTGSTPALPEQEVRHAAGEWPVKGGITGWALNTVGGLFKGYMAIVLIVLLLSGAAAAASVANKLAVGGGLTFGITIGSLGTFASSVTKGQGLVKDDTAGTTTGQSDTKTEKKEGK